MLHLTRVWSSQNIREDTERNCQKIVIYRLADNATVCGYNSHTNRYPVDYHIVSLLTIVILSGCKSSDNRLAYCKLYRTSLSHRRGSHRLGLIPTHESHTRRFALLHERRCCPTDLHTWTTEKSQSRPDNSPAIDGGRVLMQIAWFGSIQVDGAESCSACGDGF